MIQIRPALPLCLTCAVLFLSAFLSILIQPLVAKLILPLFGGSQTVWIACLLIYQMLFFLGYTFAHLLTRYPFLQTTFWLVALFSLLSLPLSLNAFSLDTSVFFQVVVLVLSIVALPYLLLSSTAPLVQHWVSTRLGKKTYHLYALSNLASFLALLIYPFWVEPFMELKTQSLIWSLFYGFYLVLILMLRFLFLKGQTTVQNISPLKNAKMAWLTWPALGTFLLVATTAALTQDIAGTPLLWLAPFAIYLLTYILAFDKRKWCSLLPNATLVIIFCFFWIFWSLAHAGNDLIMAFLVFGGVLFFGCLFAHQKAFAARPDPAHLTLFYCFMSGGSAVGGLLASLVSPLIFKEPTEMALAVSLLVLTASYHLWKKLTLPKLKVIPLLLTLCFFSVLLVQFTVEDKNVISRYRNFYGSLRIDTAKEGVKTLSHGQIIHGFQYQDDKKSMLPLSYYSQSSGVGKAFQILSQKPLNVGIVGLGTGTLSAYAKPGDHFTYFEINPDIITLAKKDFTYIANSPIQEKIILGDARLSLANTHGLAFDLLVLDAFSGDAIPTHLLTLEAFQTYQRHLKKTGIIAVHISNRYVNLAPVIAGIAKKLDLNALTVLDRSTQNDVYSTHWILLSFMPLKKLTHPASDLLKTEKNPILWTDELNSLIPLLMFIPFTSRF